MAATLALSNGDRENTPHSEVPLGELTIAASGQRQLLTAREDAEIFDSRGYANLRRAERTMHTGLQRLDREERVTGMLGTEGAAMNSEPQTQVRALTAVEEAVVDEVVEELLRRESHSRDDVDSLVAAAIEKRTSGSSLFRADVLSGATNA
jgi:hypothetical protein